MVLAASVVVTGGWFAAGPALVAQQPLAKLAQTPPAGEPTAGYTGSAACQRCHELEYDNWRHTLHVQMTKPIAEARVLGDFGPGARLDETAAGRSYVMAARNGKYFITITRTGRPAETLEINYTLGARRFQGYLSKLGDGRIYVLPVFWHNEEQRWVDYKEITPIPNDPSHDLRQIWNVTCVNCHATNLARNFDATTNTFATTWTEMGVGCEACHGPGQAHIDDPAHLKIFTMKKVAPRQIFDTCAYCHGNKNNVFFGFKAGDAYEDYALPFLISQPIPDNDPQGEFWPDGRPSRFNRPQALTMTGCFRAGQATCTSCHRIHGSQNNHALKVAIDAPRGGHTRESDTLCTQCHIGSGGSSGVAGRGAEAGARGDALEAGEAARRPTPIPDLAAHTHHDPASQGSRCINCHMSDVNWRLITRRLDHTFQPPVPEMTAGYGVPSACTTCHEDRSPEWAAATMDRWYGNGARRQAVVAMADTMYRAGSGDISVLPDVVRLTIDRSHGALIRASAAEFAGRLLVKSGGAAGSGVEPLSSAMINALIGAAADPEAMVRATAVRALSLLAASGEPRLPSVLAAHLADPSRVVRVNAVEGLLDLGIATLDGPAGLALAHAQDEWAESLRTFNDDAADHTTLGRLEEARGRTETAIGELNTAIRLDPSSAKPHVYLGVLAARAGRYDDALQQFKRAKALAPTYPNVDRLIEEAQKRR
jgi:predicted CXXCH cytochrome family protein